MFSVEGIPDTAFAEIVEYYALHAGRYCTEPARKLMAFFKNCGVRQSLLNIANFAPEPIRPRSVTDPNLVENTIAADLKAVRDGWLNSSIENYEQTRQIELARIEEESL